MCSNSTPSITRTVDTSLYLFYYADDKCSTHLLISYSPFPVILNDLFTVEDKVMQWHIIF